jgi:methylated-DNA-[protein]-cysteine S-methyltransferase
MYRLRCYEIPTAEVNFHWPYGKSRVAADTRGRARWRPLAASCAAPMSSIGYASTPLGRVLVVTSGQDLVGLSFEGHDPAPDGTPGPEPDALVAVRTQLDEYFAGIRTAFDVPIRLEGTAFQIEVWSALLEIPHGSVATYGQIARRLGRPAAARAVGAANGRNPISIVVPCHRLVGTGGELTGYGGGLDRKEWLLAHERRVAEHEAPAPRDLQSISAAPG